MGRRPRYIKKTFYGRLEHIYVLEIGPAPALDLQDRTTIFLAAIRECVLDQDYDIGMDIHLYSQEGRLDLGDLTSIQCMVARVKWGNKYAIIDRSGSLSRAIYVAREDTDEE